MRKRLAAAVLEVAGGLCLIGAAATVSAGTAALAAAAVLVAFGLALERA